MKKTKSKANSDHTTLFVPDLRTKFNGIDTILTTLAPTQTIFLGNYFHSPDGDSVEANLETARWLKRSFWDSSRIHLLHINDLQYAYGHDFLRRPTFSEANFLAINSVLTPMDWAACSFHWWAAPYCLATPCGLDESVVDKCMEEGNPDIYDFLDDAESDAWECLLRGQPHWFYTPEAAGGSVIENIAPRQLFDLVFQIHVGSQPSPPENKTSMALSPATIQAGNILPPQMLRLLHAHRIFQRVTIVPDGPPTLL